MEEKRKKKAGTFATPARRGRVDDLRRQTLMNVSNASASSRGQRANSVTSSKVPSVSHILFLTILSIVNILMDRCFIYIFLLFYKKCTLT